MDTQRVDICYRPLRIGWAITADDRHSFRRAVKYSHTLWGGSFNPILVVDRPEAAEIAEFFRVDLIVGLNDDERVKRFIQRFPHLIDPFFGCDIFGKGDKHSDPSSALLDVVNMFVHSADTTQWNRTREHGVRHFSWDDADPLGDVFLVTMGAYPSVDEVGTDYLDGFIRHTDSKDVAIEMGEKLPEDTVLYPSIASISRYGLTQHFSIHVHAGWQPPGFYVGDATDIDDLVTYWNLRACDISLQFIDPTHLQRLEKVIPEWRRRVSEYVSRYRDEFRRRPAVWSRRDDIDSVCKRLKMTDVVRYPVSEHLWNGLNISAPVMQFGESSTLGVVGEKYSKKRLSFQLVDKPYSSGIWFHSQHLIASIDVGRIYGDEQQTWSPPYVPELNEFYAREMFFQYSSLRVELSRVGLIVDANDRDTFLSALSVTECVQRIFKLAGYESTLSAAGLMVKQLIAQLNGLQGGRVFKIPGVRRLIKSHGLTSSIRKSTALHDIGYRDANRSDSNFKNHENLFIEQRSWEEKLTPQAVFEYLVEKGLFRIGADLKCPSCNLVSWFSLDALNGEVICELCGNEFDTTRQLTASDSWRYRRSGILGRERNVQGAIPVALTLQQLDTSLRGAFDESVYAPSMNLVPQNGRTGPSCETDFTWLVRARRSWKTAIILAECKDSGSIAAEDVEKLNAVASCFDRRRFDTYILLAKLSAFSDEEIEAAKKLNSERRNRAILLTEKELEPYLIGEKWRDSRQFGTLHWSSPEDMAESTAKIYFANSPSP